MIQLLCVHAVAAVVAPLLFRLLGRKAFALLALAPASAAVWALTKTRAVFGGELPSQDFAWVPQLSLNLTFRLDSLSWLMVLIVGGIGALILVYCGGYFGHGASSLGRFGGVFVAFAGAMLGLVTSDNTVVLYLFWELTTVFSFLLIGHYSDRTSSRRAAQQAIIVTTVGGLAMLVGIVMLGEMPGGSYSFSGLLASASAGTLGQGTPELLSAAVVLMLIGAFSKSALIPFHFWLPAAMAAPTPVSAYLHAAAMVKAGVYLVARLAPGLADVAPWRPMVLIAGIGTLLIGGYRALKQHDIKLVLAFGTVSQLGFMVLLLGIGTQAAALAGIAWLLFLSGTPLSVPALTGTIMTMGVATANSILVVSFCRERLAEHGDALKAALEAGYTRFRPVCMTALAMMIGMLPLALSEEQNAPLGRAVIGGLMLATVATLLFVPVVFSLVHGREKNRAAAGETSHVV